jgi:hypothetical protein
MAKALRTVGKVAGIVATVAAFIPGGQPIAAAAAAVAAVANIGAEIAAKKPPARGSVTQTQIGTDLPSPYIIGRTYTGHSRQHQIGYGATRKKVPNPYLLAVDVASVAGPVEELESCFADFSPIAFSGNAATGYFDDFLWRDVQLGATPEPSALSPQWAGAPGWTASSRLSGKAAIAWSMLFDKDGKVFASGVPQLGAVWKGVKCYDPRKDSTYPGGSGSHRWADPRDTAAFAVARQTWEYSECPGLHGLKYALGSWQRNENDPAATYRRVFGVGIPSDGLRIGDFVHLANVCDANGWKVGGVIYEPASRWNNLKDILAAGGAEPGFVGGRLGAVVSAPRVPMDTITADDLAEGEIVAGAMRGWEARLNTLVPKYRSEQHKWEYIQTTPVSVSAFVDEDGEEKSEERQINLVQNAKQAAELCAYELFDRRELGDIEIPCKPRLRRYGAGDLLIVDLPEAGLVMQPCVVIDRVVDPAGMTVSFVLRGETADKHAFALGRTATAPPTPRLTAIAEVDELALEINGSATWDRITGDGKPEDNATVGAPAGTPIGDREAQAVVDDLTSAVDGIALETMRAATWRGESDQVIYMPDGTPVRTTVEAIGTTVDGHQTFVAFLKEVSGDGVAKFMLSARADGSIVGIQGTAGGGVDQLAFVASKFLFVDNSGQNPVNALAYENGVWKLKAIEVDTITYGALIPKFGGQYSSFDANGGWEIMPSGVIRQWGRFRQSINRQTTFSIVFPRPFSNAVHAVMAMPYLATYSNQRDLWIQNVGQPSLSGATFGTQSAKADDTNLDGFDWQAWGN